MVIPNDNKLETLKDIEMLLGMLYKSIESLAGLSSSNEIKKNKQTVPLEPVVTSPDPIGKLIDKLAETTEPPKHEPIFQPDPPPSVAPRIEAPPPPVSKEPLIQVVGGENLPDKIKNDYIVAHTIEQICNVGNVTFSYFGRRDFTSILRERIKAFTSKASREQIEKMYLGLLETQELIDLIHKTISEYDTTATIN